MTSFTVNILCCYCVELSYDVLVKIADSNWHHSMADYIQEWRGDPSHIETVSKCLGSSYKVVTDSEGHKKCYKILYELKNGISLKDININDITAHSFFKDLKKIVKKDENDVEFRVFYEQKF